MVLEIRCGREEDISGIAKVLVDTWRATFADRLPSEYLDGLSYAHQEKRHRRMFGQPDAIYHVAVDDEVMVGFASGGPSRHDRCPDANEVYAIYVLPTAQRRNIGSILFRRIVTDLQKSDRRGLVTMALALNPYRHFYARLGGIETDGGTIKLGPVVAEQIAYTWADTSELTLRVIPVTSSGDWAAYHEIRRRVLFEARGLDGYDPDHPDDRKDGHFPLLLLRGTVAVGAARLDIIGDDQAIVRTVAIRTEFQRQGFGREIMSGIENFAMDRGVASLTVNAAPDAVEFYRHCGWAMVDETKPEPLLAKEL
ncbi:GNAT family N-acetyltransferase [Rhizobium sp. 11_C7_N12_5]|uniref:GNAT family N-acetyltransferase n=1 Tax=Rhizobium sp. 11_C7_N12_5 TaxID=3240770 RepID=UPI003F25CE22